MFEAYKVAVKLALVNHVSTGLAAIAAQLTPLNKQFKAAQAGADGLKRELLSIKQLGMVGGALAGLGFGGMSLMKGPLEEAKQFEKQVAKFRLFGLGDEVTNEAAAYAKAMKVMGSTAVENMRLVNEAQGVFRESGLAGSQALEGAKLAAPMLAKIQFATEGLDDESKERMRTQSMAMLRFVEMRGGLKDAATFNSIADLGWKAIQTSGGNVNWEQMRQFMARGGVAAQGLTDTSLFGKLEPIIGELKGSTAGNAWMTAYNRLVGGVKVPNQVAHMLAENGIWDAKQIEWNSMGGIKRFKQNPLKDMATFSTDPVEFYEKNILPMYARMNHGKGLDSTERARENTMIFGRTGGMMFSLIDRQLATIHKSVAAQAKALGVDDSVKTAGGTLAGKEVDLHAKWRDAQRQLGETILPLAIKAVEGLTSSLRTFIDFARQHPTTIKALTLAFVGLSGAMAFGGTVMLLTAGFRGLRLALSVLGASEGALALASKGLTMVGSAVGKLGAVGLAFGAGWAVGELLNKTLIEGTRFSNWLGGIIARLMSPFSKDAREAVEATDRAEGKKPLKNTFLTEESLKRADQAYGRGWGMPLFAKGSLYRDDKRVPTVVQAAQQAPATPNVIVQPGQPAPASPIIMPAIQQQAAPAPIIRESVRNAPTAPQPERKPMTPPPAPQMVQVSVTNSMDGRKIGEIVSTHIAKQTSRGLGTGFFDSNLTMPLAGTN